MSEPMELINAYLDGRATDEQFAELVRWIEAYPKNARTFQRVVLLEQQMVEDLNRREAEELALHRDNAMGDEVSGSGFGRILMALDDTKGEAVQPVDISDVLKQREMEAKAKRAESQASFNRRFGRSVQQDSGSQTRHYVIPRPLFYGSIAALIAVAVAIIWPMAKPDQPEPAPVGPQPRAVATLTGELDARWEEVLGSAGQPKVGDLLTIGQRLQLRTGSAEITTNYGAKVILESPCSVEFIDNDNGFRLHRGKVVGLIETDKARGFVIRTNHVDVTDFGTKFGVDASNQSATEVHVFEGDVEVARPSKQDPAKTVRKRLLRGQAARATAESADIEDIKAEASQFVTTDPENLDLRNTGIKLSEGDRDRHWRISEIGGNSPRRNMTSDVLWVTGYGIDGGLANDPTKSQWIGLVEQRVKRNQKSYVFSTEIELPTDMNPMASRIDLKFIVDNHLDRILVNGEPIDVPAHGFHKYSEMTSVTIDRHLRPGQNKIEFVVSNINISEPNPVALRVEWNATVARKWPAWTQSDG